MRHSMLSCLRANDDEFLSLAQAVIILGIQPQQFEPLGFDSASFLEQPDMKDYNFHWVSYYLFSARELKRLFFHSLDVVEGVANLNN